MILEPLELELLLLAELAGRVGLPTWIGIGLRIGIIYIYNDDDHHDDDDDDHDDDDDDHRPWQAGEIEQAEDPRRWESETRFLFF